MAQPLITLVGEEIAEEGKTFVFMGEQLVCTECKLRNICLNLDKGARYRIVKVRDPQHDCDLTEGKVQVVEVEKMSRTVCVDKKYAIDGSFITFFPSNCGQPGCPHYHMCNPDGIENETKVKILSVGKKAKCEIGQNRMVVELE